MERGPNDLEERLEMLEKQKKLMQDKLRQAGARIKDLEEINKSHQKLVGGLMTGNKKPQWDDTE
tara:strand:+ start:203 stop:394 length:192 start_codon:yes stop_codon:yes gene_type:complete